MEPTTIAPIAATTPTTQVYRRLLEPWQLTYPQYLALVTLWNDGDQTFLDAQVDRLAERLRTRLGAGAV
jgi:DNA-binding MarR family transcriptional regulator